MGRYTLGVFELFTNYSLTKIFTDSLLNKNKLRKNGLNVFGKLFGLTKLSDSGKILVRDLENNKVTSELIINELATKLLDNKTIDANFINQFDLHISKAVTGGHKMSHFGE